MKRLYLVDAHAYLHRAYHALPPLATSSGFPVGALLGFARMLLALLKAEKPEEVAVCFDTPGPTFRHKLLESYKAQRKPLDADLAAQLAQAPALAEAMGFACFAAEGYEADDVMATLAGRAARSGSDVVLVTGDKDALQLVGPRVRVLNLAKGERIGPREVEKKFGVPPGLMVDFLALTGDATDNVPGVRGIGPVGARELLKRFGGLEGVLKAARKGEREIPARQAEALRSGESAAREAVRLIRLDDQAPLNGGSAHPAWSTPDPERLKGVLGRFEFHALMREMLPRSAEPPPAPASSGEPQAGSREVSFEELEPALSREKAVALAVLGPGREELLPEDLPVLALAAEDGRVCLLGAAGLKARRPDIERLLGGRGTKVVYDLKEARRALAALGLPASGGSWFDARLAAYLADPSGFKGLKGAPAEGREALLARARACAGWRGLQDELEALGLGKLLRELEQPLLESLAAMEDAGILVDAEYLRRLAAAFGETMERLSKEIEGRVGRAINLNSPKQLAELFYDELELPVARKTQKGGRSTDEEALRALAQSSEIPEAFREIPARVLEYRELAKLRSTYAEGLLERLDPRTGRVHTHFDPAGTATGRLSSVDPNLQNIPIRTPAGQKIRRAFQARPGWTLLSADYSQIDLRVLAHVSGDAVLREAFRRGEDVHTRTACEIFSTAPEAVDAEMRRRAKAVNFGIVYGQSAHGLALELGIPRPQAAAFVKSYFERYAGVARWHAENLARAKAEGLVRTFSGRLRRLPELKAQNASVRAFGERAAANTPIQGGSADVIKHAMLKLWESSAESPSPRAVLLLQIHDELLFEVPRSEAAAFAPWVRRVMEGAVRLDVPLVVDLKAGPNWQDMERLK